MKGITTRHGWFDVTRMVWLPWVRFGIEFYAKRGVLRIGVDLGAVGIEIATYFRRSYRKSRSQWFKGRK